MKYFIAFALVFSSLLLHSQCAECPVGSVVITGSTNITNQNMAADYCITGVWTGGITGIGNNSTITICPSASWEISADLLLQNGMVVTNYGTITDNGSGALFKIQGQTDLFNEVGGTINVEQFENQDTEFINAGTLIAADIYIHGPSENSGTIQSTAQDCAGLASTLCGFFIGNKNQSLINTGTVTAVDALLKDGIVGNGMFIATGTLGVESNGGITENNFNVNNLFFQQSANMNTGIFVVNGDFDCNNANVSNVTCLEGGTQSGACSNSSDPIVECSTLPVEIISFDIKQINEKLVHSWEVRSEVDVSHYELLHSSTGYNFTKVAEIPAENASYYQYVMDAMKEKVSYFKLKSVDLDGSEQAFDKVRMVRNGDFYSVVISPNPATRDDVLSVKFDYRQDALIEIYNTMGEKITASFFKDRNNIDLNLDKIQVSGLYLIKVSTTSGSFTKEVFIN